MLDPWNDSSILPPPVNMFLCRQEIDLPGLRYACNNVIKVLSNQSPLHKEGAICSRLIYKYDHKFRNDIGYRNLRKVNTALKKYLTLNLLKDVQNFSSALPTCKDDEMYLPTRQMLVYVLLRIIAFSKIMLRICTCSKQAAIFYLDRIKRGESHWMSLLPFALLCRLWSLTKVLVQHSVSWYSNLYSYVEKLELKGVNFLPDSYELPENLDKLIDIKNIDNYGKFEWSQKKFISVNYALMEDNNDLFDSIFEFVNKSNNDDETDIKALEEFKPTLEAKCQNLQAPVLISVDHGEVLSRESFNTLLNKQNKTPLTNKYSPIKVTNVYSLIDFLNKEEKLRNDSSEDALSKHLSFMQWQALKNVLAKLCEGPTNRKIGRKFQQIWKEKCLDYM